ncbi:helix-hairpin-helix domain-containing protein [Anditalea andensis]|uniref:DNA polymerase IV n=1 Tax=Anditalea andensis TaxID=1048983 RepID=A0A074KWV1_9BACT|nr:helix-hairpin-helix domain-containing protein [Anditalea andensis]KEO74461.1 DNA polymerase IV [Anditalea andensis]
MDNKSIIKKLKLAIQLMELHEANPFKIRSYQSALNTIDRGDISLEETDPENFQDINGIGKSIAEVLKALLDTGTFPYLEELIAQTPEGLLEVMEIKGLGPKKIRTLWQQLGITSTHELLEACQSGQVAAIKGFGVKTQETIIASLNFRDANKGKWLYGQVDHAISDLKLKLEAVFGEGNIKTVGEFARNAEIIETVEWIVKSNDTPYAIMLINKESYLIHDKKSSSPYTWRGQLISPEIKIVIHFIHENKFINELLIRTSSRAHLHALAKDQTPLATVFRSRPFGTEQEAYEAAGLQYIVPELREGFFEIDLAKDNKLPVLLKESDLKGVLHNHSTYSDGKHTLRAMAEYCQSMGYEYLGISDHSRTAIYAGGLDIDKVTKQQSEIKALNEAMAPFKIFSGIESDILGDGSLDYPDDVLASFDFIVASIHSILNMDKKKATTRLIKAIENPYTTMLGHPTGRLLLRRDGYPIDHKAIIDACALHNVVIEINANPWRLDLDWRWVHYAISQGIKLSINPDAHDKVDFAHMKYGVLVGRKGGLTKEMTLNAMSLTEISSYFNNRKASIGKVQ